MNSAYLIPVFPFAAFVVNILFGRHLKKAAGLISVAASLASSAVALPLAWKVASTHHPLAGGFEWLPLETSVLSFGYFIDPLAATLLFVVTVVGTLIQIYSLGYMSDEPRFSRFFAAVSLFMAAMLTVVIADNYVLFFMAWEIMGLCSYLLIGFYAQKDSAADASLKAFLTTRVGDVGFFLGILTLFAAAGTLEFAELPTAVGAPLVGALQAHGQAQGLPLLPIAALLIFCGTIGKSAQVPLHVWLPDAMEGPTPVSALIHAATMVAAGVYLLARSAAVFTAAPEVLALVALVGTLTAFLAAFIALTQTDIKKVLAYSTISQLGFMVAAFGLKGFTASTFHLMTHAFFKALLFLGAGSVIHGTHTQDLREMGGLFGKMKHTALTFIIASLAIAGVPPLSGFWSKDEILAAAFDSGNLWIFGILLLTALMTAFYMFRLVFLTFFGEPRNHKIHAHESPAVMTLPLWALAIGAVLVGLPGSPFFGHWFQTFLEGGHHGGEHAMNPAVMFASVAAGLGGIFLAGLIYLKNLNWADALAQRFNILYNLSFSKLMFDEIYAAWIVRPFQGLGRVLFGFDEKVVDGVVNQTGFFTLWTSRVKFWIDLYLVDGLVNFTGHFTQAVSAALRRAQTGLVQHYLLIVFLSVLILIFTTTSS